MLKKIGVLMVTILGGALLVYSATRSLDFIELTLPPDRQILAYFGLAALDGGIIAWMLSYLYGSRGSWQRAISVLMLIVDVIGAIAMFTFDTLYNTGKSGMTEAMAPELITNAVLALSAIIALNIIATIAHHMTEPNMLREQAEEEAFSKVEEATLKQIASNADQLAAQLAPTMAADWMEQTRARYTSYLGSGKLPPIDITAQDVTSKPSAAYMHEPKKPLSLSALWAGLMNNMNNWKMNASGRNFQSNTVSPLPNIDLGTVTLKPQPQAVPNAGKVYTLSELLAHLNKTQDEARQLILNYGLDTPQKAFDTLSNYGFLPSDISLSNFAELYRELFANPTPAPKP